MDIGSRPLWWRRSRTQPAPGLAQQIVVVTDIDGSLLELDTNDPPGDRAALDFLAAHDIPLVINSSRTRAEIERLHHTLQILTPFISEHGSALFVPHGCFPFVPERAQPALGGSVIEFSRRYHDVVDALRLTSRQIGVEIVGLSELTIEEAAHELGVPIVEAQLAKLREYTELYRIVAEKDATRSRLFKALRRRGLRSWRTGSHHLVTATTSRADSLRALKAIWKQAWRDPFIVGLGDSEDDVAWLQYADVAVVVQGERADVARVLSKLPMAHVTQSPGRRGWSEAIFEFVGALLHSQQPVKPYEFVGPTARRSDDRPP